MKYPACIPRSAKELYFSGEPVPEVPKEWRKEMDLIDCQNCGYSYDCYHRNHRERLPADAGGDGQCLRLAKYLSPYAFKNVDGQIIIIPDSVVEAIRGLIP